MDDLVTPGRRRPDPDRRRSGLRIGRLVGIAKRVGYLGLLVAIVGFVVSVVAGFPVLVGRR